MLLKGMLLGFSIAAPVGPIGVLCIRRSLAGGFRSGLASGLGAATADALYGTLAAAGLTLVADFLAAQSFWMGLLGGCFLLYLGIRSLLSQPAQTQEEAPARSSGGDFISTFLLTLSNPMTIFAFVAIFSGLGTVGSSLRLGAFLLVLGVFSGSALWWLGLSAVVSMLRTRISDTILLWVNRAAGVVIIGFALVIMGRVLGK